MERLQRPRQPMSEDIESLLKDRGLKDAYLARPPYQRNDYLGWIAQAAQDWTRQKRIEQMLLELEAGNVYMKMPWRAGKVADEQ
jgi:uncharacterized protein YdeI (YjbR/CyaY-like superfamily)